MHDYPFCTALQPGMALPTTEYRTFLDFFNSRQGAFDSFLFDDPTDDTAIGQMLVPVPGDDTGTMFQLARQLAPGGINEWIIAPNVVSAIYINGSPTGSYTLDPSTGIVTFSSPPGGTVTADFTYYFPVRFEDAIDFENFAHLYWRAQQVKLRSVLGVGVPAPAVYMRPAAAATPIIIFSPAIPMILDTTPLGTTVDTITILTSTGTVYAGPAPVFAAPNFDDGGRFIITGPASGPGPYLLVLNPLGPGLPLSLSTEHITVAVPGS
jgi:hypothetical protein